MSLYFEERIIEQKENDPSNDKITFIHPWILTTIPWHNQDGTVDFYSSKIITTCYNANVVTWDLICEKIGRNQMTINAIPFTSLLWNPICNISYSLFYDSDMRFELYSSPKISAIPSKYSPQKNITIFKTPDGFLTRFYDALQNGRVLKAVIFFEFTTSESIFNRPFEHPLHFFNKKMCEEYPKDMENDFRFEFMKDR
uniref:Uncharacterized protein n=1 Tax=Panagrolaimus davidi TaxID=227884 RepID=A0A914QR81_9BILA